MSAWGRLGVAVVGRLGSFLLRLGGAVLLFGLLLGLAPGDAIDMLPNSDQLRPVLEAEWGLNEPLGTRLVHTVGRLAAGDLGTSLTYRPGAAVVDLVRGAAGESLSLLLPALLLSVGTAVALGWYGARTPGRLLAPLRALSVPPAFLAAFLGVTAINAATWELMERGTIARPAWFALPDSEHPARTIFAVVVLAFASGSLAELQAACEAEIVALRRAPFIEAARARGAAVWPHLLGNLLPPLVHLSAERVAWLLSGLVVVEKVLLVNGAGAMLWQACRVRDYPLAVGLTLAGAVTVSLGRLFADLLRIWLDPRLRGTG